jgi:hypothetical protein
MNLEYGALVKDKNDEIIGNINHIILDTWTGEQRKFGVRRSAPQTDVFFSPDQVAKATKEKVELNVSMDELE